MCKSIAEGGHRCRCKTAKAASDKRDAAAKRQKRYANKKRAERAAAAATLTPEPVDTAPDTSPEADPVETEQAVARLTDYLTAIRASEDAEHAQQVAAAVSRTADQPNPFTGLTITPTADPVTVDDAFTDHLAREAAEEREREAGPKPPNPFTGAAWDQIVAAARVPSSQTAQK